MVVPLPPHDVCAVCGEPLDDDYIVLHGEPVCADSSACVQRWLMTSRSMRRLRVKHFGTEDAETR
jgi:predicted nucleic acid-binding Zn ribbon protein